MALKTYKPATPGLRQLIISDTSQVGESAADINASTVLSTLSVINLIVKQPSRESNMILTARLSLH